jgi:hypothetical protein
VRDTDADRRTAADRYRDHPAREGAAVGEPRALEASGRSARQRDPAAGDRVRADDEFGLIAGFRVDEQQQEAVSGVIDRRESLGSRIATRRA